MTINWLVDEPIGRSMAFDPVFKSNGVLISIAGTYPTTWVKAGYLEITIEVDGQPFIYASKLVKLGNNVISIGIRDYKLSFNPVIYIDDRFNPTIKIAEQELDMGVNFPSQRATGNVDEVIKTASVTSQEILADNPDRAAGGVIYNKTNKSLYVRWGTTAATSSNILVPANGNLDIPDEYTGAAQGISASAATGTIVIQTLSYV